MPANLREDHAADEGDGETRGCWESLRRVADMNTVARAWESSVVKYNGKPQFDGAGVARFGEHWGISRGQCIKLLQDLHDDPHWERDTNMYTFVNERVKSWTKGTGMGLALLLNRSSPLPVNKMISHCWAESVEEFLSQVIESSSDGDVLFICAFSIYQCEDGAGPSIEEQIGTNPAETPFGRVLSSVKHRDLQVGWLATQHRNLAWMPSGFLVLSFLLFFAFPIWSSRLPKWDGQCHGVLLNYNGTNQNGLGSAVPESFDRCIPNGVVCAKYIAEPCPSYAWPLQIAAFVLAAVAVISKALQMRLPSAGGMIVVPTRAADIYTRLWCVYEIFFGAMQMEINVELARTLTKCGTCTSATATCSSQADLRRIRAEVEAHGGFNGVDKAVRRVTWDSRLQMGLEFARAFLAGSVGLPTCAQLAGSTPSGAKGIFSSWIACCLVGLLVVFGLLIPKQGTLTRKQAWFAGIWLPLLVLVLGNVVGGLARDTCTSDDCVQFWSGGMVGISAFPLCYIVGLLCVYGNVRSQQSWSYHLSQYVTSTAAMVQLTIVLVAFVIPNLGTHHGKFGQLLPLYDFLICSIAGFSCGIIFFVYLPRLLLTFNVHLAGADGTAADQASRRAIRPTRGERLVFFWQRRLLRFFPVPALPEGLDSSRAPAELAARGLDDDRWCDWIGKLRAVREAAWRDPRMWLWTAAHVAWFFLAILIGPLAAALVCLPSCWLPVNRYQRGLQRWMNEFNSVLAPLGMLVKAQTIRRGEAEVSYLSFALTQQEAAILQEEPIFAPGHCLSFQQGRANPAPCPVDRGRVV